MEIHGATNKAAAKVCLGFLPQSSFDLEFTVKVVSQDGKDEIDIVKAQQFIDHILRGHQEVGQHLFKSQQKYKERHDKY